MTTEGATQSVESVGFSFFTKEDVRKLSVIQITNTNLLDIVERPVPGGLYDPAMGPLDERTPCKSCGQLSRNCPGHCGHIELIVPLFNPLLFNFLYTILQRVCHYCFHFRASRTEVERCVSQLKLIIKGDIIGAKTLESPCGSSYPEDSDGSHASCSTVHSVAETGSCGQEKQQSWTSLHQTEAMSILYDFLKKKGAKCQNCGAKNPKISKPTFGWFRTSMLDAHNRANVIRGIYSGESKGTLSEAEDIDNSTIIEDGVESHSPASRSQDTAKNKYKKGEDVPMVFSKQKGGTLVPKLVKETVIRLWENEDVLCSFITDIQQQGSGKKADPSILFLETILVPPIKFRPPSKGGDAVMEHPQTVLLNKVLQSNISLGNALENKSARLESRWLDLQQAVNVLFDSKTATGQGQKEKTWGICQLLEKKEGMFRQKMMGKRVNFACRSVISPDPYLAVNEIGIPPYFASRLTYPERVTPWNVAKMRNAIINGPDNPSGATHYVENLSVKRLPSDRKSRISIAKKLPSSRGAVTQHGRSSDYEFEGKVVHRHLQDGDVVLVNRQPTLHKPSIMAHVVRVLKGEKTIRMHYANCSTYNADFDGDEMNVHFPQDEISRAEGYHIVNANNQYVVPSHGQPIRALIQDHIISGVLLTMKDCFLDRDTFHQLLYSSGVLSMRSAPFPFAGKRGRKVFISVSEAEMQTVPPVIWKPEPLWTGKQVITAILNIITVGRHPFTVGNETKLDKDFFKTKNLGHLGGDKEDCKVESKKKDNKGTTQGLPGENRFIIYKNELINGVLDKAQFGIYGMVHMVQELYGASAAGILLSAMSRLFTAFLQMHGFTCGVDDLMMMRNSEEKREKDLKNCEKCGEKSHFEFLGLREGEIDNDVLPTKIEEAVCAYGESALTGLDMKVVSALRTAQEPMQELLSHGLCKPSVKNCFSLMTTSGAKGSKSNFQQVCSYLGQQELEGKRVPRMVSGKTLPCFSAWDIAPRAGGYIADRFLSGLRPQEYYFHCMAGREGLVDTAVKTSRSGYLQRCLIKNLECLKVGYDHTVRDVDGSIVQFRYGEDGVDVHQTSFIEQFQLLASNHEVIDEKRCPLNDTNKYIKKLPSGLVKKAKEFIKNNEKLPSRLHGKDAFLSLIMHKYMSSLVQPGEPVGVIAAQSVGEPSTQMTLNTFHHAGRGEMNVTLGIPRLQEILMRASSDIKTPIMTCPLLEGRTEEDAKRLAAKLRKITLADIMESMEVSVVPFAVQDGEMCTIYKLKIKLYAPDRFPDYSDISLKECEEIFEIVYVRELEDAIQNHLSVLSRITGIKNFTPVAQSKTSDELEGDISESGPYGGNEIDDNDKDCEEAEDLGVDAQKQKQQATDEVDYEDGSDVEECEAEATNGSESQSGQDENDNCIAEDDVDGEVVSGPPSKTFDEKDHSKSKSNKVRKAKRVKKEFDRAIHVAAKGLNFEVHFKFTNEPHILLAQVAQRTAEKVSIQNPGKINNCRLVTCESKNQVVYYGGDLKERKELGDREKEKLPALKTAGVDFSAFWKMQDDLDVSCIYSNNIQEVLNVYGVEAARETIVREVNHVFKSYSVSVNRRHLTLIADYMTFSGSYRPMNRLGGIAESISPFCKISFETAAKFIVEAACHGQKDNLESPSSRICLGLPVRVGTGCFDLMQKLSN